MRERGRTARVPPGRRAGRIAVGGLALLAVVAWLAPLIATDAPLLARRGDGFGSPALRRMIGGAPTPDARPILAAPIPYDPVAIDLNSRLEPPSTRHPMGTDALGRDLAARVVHGARISLAIGIVTALLTLLVGVPLGAVAGYYRGWVDAAISRVVEVSLCVPTLLIALALLAADPHWLRGLGDVPRIALVLALPGWIPITRYVRAEYLRLAASEVAFAARATGAGHLRVATRHLLPAALAPSLITAAFAVAGAIAAEATLSFLGLGVQPPVATWGVMLAESRERIPEAWWMALFPGVALFGTLLACNLVGEALRDRLDPRS